MGETRLVSHSEVHLCMAHARAMAGHVTLANGQARIDSRTVRPGVLNSQIECLQ